MKNILSIVLLTAGTFWLLACKQDPALKIPALEKNYAITHSETGADSLILAYREAVKAHPDKHSDNLHFLSKAAEIAFFHKKDALSAVRFLTDALHNEGSNQNLTEPITILARIWYRYQYKSTPDLFRNPDDIDLLRATLERNTLWIDSSLARMDKSLGGASLSSKTEAEPFIEVAEAYSTLIQTTNPDKHVSLLMKAAGLARATANANKALQLYYNVADKLPAHPKAPTALFMMGFIYENDLKDLSQAKNTYEKFLKTYPNDPDYADDAQNALKFLGKSPEEIIREFEKRPQ